MALARTHERGAKRGRRQHSSHDIAVPVASVPEFVARANRLVELMIPGARPVPFGHLGDGNIHYNVSQPPGMERAVSCELGGAQRRRARDRARSWRSISAEHGIGRLKRDSAPCQAEDRARYHAEDQGGVRPEQHSQSRKAPVMKRLETDALWMAVDDYFNGLLAPNEPVLEAALQATKDAGLPPINVAPNQWQAADAARARDRRPSHLGDRHARGLQHDLAARGLAPEGRMVTIEWNPACVKVARAELARAGLGSQVDVREGSGEDVLPELVAEAPFRSYFHRCRQAQHTALFRVGGKARAKRFAHRRGQCRARGRDPR